MTTSTMEEVQVRLPELLDHLTPGEDVLITRDGKPMARLSYDLPVGAPIPGRCRGMMTIVSDGDEHLKDFEQSM